MGCTRFQRCTSDDADLEKSALITTDTPGKNYIRQLLEESAATDTSLFDVVGIDDDSVEEDRVRYGWNELKADDTHCCCKLFDSFKDPLIIMIILSALISVATQQYKDAICISIAVIIVTLVGFLQQYRSEKTLKALNNMVPYTTQCIRNGSKTDILTRELIPGDVVEISIGDRVPADIRLLECAGLEMDESSITGETLPCPKHSEPVIMTKDLVELSNIVYTGTLVCNGHGKGIVIGTGYNTEFGEIYKMMESEERPKTPLQENIMSLTKFFTINTLVVIGVIMVIGLVKGRTFQYMMSLCVSLAVASIPEGLPIVVTVTLALGVVRMGKKKAMVRNLPAVETLGCVNCLCVDKTGTLTKNEMTVTVATTASGHTYEVTGTGYFESGHLIYNNTTLLHCPEDLELLAKIGFHCNNAYISEDKMLGKPTDASLIAFARKLRIKLNPELILEEIPFTHERKWMGVKCFINIHGSHEKYFLIKGATENVIKMCSHVLANKALVPMTDLQEEAILDQVRRKEDQAMRTLSMCYGNSLTNLVYAGHVGIVDPIRNEVPKTITSLRRNSIQIKMITGDSRNIAISIGKKLRIYWDSDTILSGAMIDDMSDSTLINVITAVPIIYRSTPKHKMRVIKALQANDLIVAMTGDGVNDAVALKCADIGIAMGRGTDVCKEAAEMVLVNDDISLIMDAVREGKNIYLNIKNFVRYFCCISASCLVLISITTIFDLPQPLTPMQILWINLFMDGPPAQSLGAEPVSSTTVDSPPRCPKKQVIDGVMMLRIGLTVTTMIGGVLGVLWVFQDEVMKDNVIIETELTTMTFTCFIFFSLFYSLSCRSHSRSILQIDFFGNRSFVFVFLLSIVAQLAIIFVPFLQTVFQTQALSAKDIMTLFGVSSSVLIVDEVIKCFLRLSESRAQK